SARGGYFYDNYADTGIPNVTSVLWNVPSIGVPGLPASLQLPNGTQNTPRALISHLDTTKTALVQVDYNHMFNAAGVHQLKGGAGLRHTINDADNAYPGGYVLLDWGLTFRSSATGQSGTGTFGYYEVNDRGTRGKVSANMPSLFIQDAWTVN